MSRYIDAELIDFSCLKNEFDKARAKVIIMGQPTADVVEVRHGYWLSAYEFALKKGVTNEKLLENTKNDKRWKFCSFCDQQVKWDFDYCPDCGAKMDGERKDDET